MKTIKIIYWICTIIICGLMLFSAVMTFIPQPPNPEMVKLGYPGYIFKFLAVAKMLGVVAILVPGFRRLKEWAYAGFFFDLLGATYSFIAIGDPVGAWAPMFIFIAILLGSYFTYHKNMAA
ncbi:DoxX family protein [Mucilaginibacter ginsenosidivorans]|uniref:DoxX family protein n=1 Tax=Mucilaginibacter ginsenosidivorans TaxID=398053 RepID=A0A5B8USL6_9SPHI|nr:DoxX family protein [Mucilaginibacter ginsenosidivorans]QEC61994.1 DoxX family protein [Mucilaginibacter ginsenosidivorans]